MIRATTLAQDVFPCFEAGLLDEAGKTVNAEISAVAWDGKRLVMASDKPIPGAHRSAVFALECNRERRPQAHTLTYYTAPLIRSAKKYEDFALTVSGDHIVATTGFDRYAADSAESHQYNQLLVWPSGRPEQARVVADTEDDGIDSSVGLRKQLAALLGAPYFKIEGLATVPGADGDDLLLFGVREIGQNFDDFRYAVCLVGAPYRLHGDDLVFTGDFSVLYDFDPTGWPGLRHVVGVSSLEYDAPNNRLYILTSFEVTNADGTPANGGYLWAVSMDAFHARRDPQLIANEHGEPLEFANKAEGLAVIDGRHVLIAYDPDRHLELAAGHRKATREPHEAPYTLLRIE